MAIETHFPRPREQAKAVLTLDPVPELAETASVKVLDNVGNKAKEKLPNFRDGDNGALLVDLCEKAIALCKTYNLYNDNGDWKTMAQAQHCALYASETSFPYLELAFRVSVVNSDTAQKGTSTE